MGERIVMLADLDSFFVAVERIYRPELRGVPVVVGGPPESRGVIAACSYEARALGLHSAMPMGQAVDIAQASAYAVLNRQRLSPSAMFTPRRRQAPPGLPPSRQRAEPQAVPLLDLARVALPFMQRIRAQQIACGSIVGPIVFLHGDWLHGGYSEHSRRVQDILRESVPDFITRSIDEFELDISGCSEYLQGRFGGVLDFAQHLRARVKGECNLNLSLGIGPNRILAKMASKQAKPHKALPGIRPQAGERGSGIMLLRPEDARAFLEPLPVQEVPGIGPATTATLNKDGIRLIGDLLGKPRNLLLRLYHKPLAGLVETLLDHTEGRADSALPAISRRIRPKSIGHSSTFSSDQSDPAVFERKLWELLESACRRLRAADLRARHVTVTVRYSDFTTVSHGGMLAEPCDNERQIFPSVQRFFAEGRKRSDRIRLLGVRLEQLGPGSSQPLLFGGVDEERERRFFGALDLIRDRYGDEALVFGRSTLTPRSKRERPGLAAGGQPSSFAEASPALQKTLDERRAQERWLLGQGITPGTKAAERALGKYPGT
ncbi:DNA polymerase IV [bacterium]|nr:DNA polymerase IV [bacterium]